MQHSTIITVSSTFTWVACHVVFKMIPGIEAFLALFARKLSYRLPWGDIMLAPRMHQKPGARLVHLAAEFAFNPWPGIMCALVIIKIRLVWRGKPTHKALVEFLSRFILRATKPFVRAFRRPIFKLLITKPAGICLPFHLCVTNVLGVPHSFGNDRFFLIICLQLLEFDRVIHFHRMTEFKVEKDTLPGTGNRAVWTG